MRHVPLAALLAFVSAGCIHPPEIVVVDRATALEEQAAGSFEELERDLGRAAMTPHPVPMTPAELEALGIRPKPLVDQPDPTDADHVDELLRQHCVGEQRDGLLAETADACRASIDTALATTLVERVNHARLQLWRWMHELRPATKPDEVRRSWTKVHVQGVVCGGWIQRDDGAWEAKKC
jgi:Protein of unknown function (DUF1318)